MFKVIKKIGTIITVEQMYLFILLVGLKNCIYIGLYWIVFASAQ